MTAVPHTEFIAQASTVIFTNEPETGALVASFHIAIEMPAFLVVKMTAHDVFGMYDAAGAPAQISETDIRAAIARINEHFAGYLPQISAALKRWAFPFMFAPTLYRLLVRFLPDFIQAVADDVDSANAVGLLLPLADLAHEALMLEIRDMTIEGLAS